MCCVISEYRAKLIIKSRKENVFFSGSAHYRAIIHKLKPVDMPMK